MTWKIYLFLFFVLLFLLLNNKNPSFGGNKIKMLHGFVLKVDKMHNLIKVKVNNSLPSNELTLFCDKIDLIRPEFYGDLIKETKVSCKEIVPGTTLKIFFREGKPKKVWILPKSLNSSFPD